MRRLPANSYLSDAILQRDLDLVRFVLTERGEAPTNEACFSLIKGYAQLQQKLIKDYEDALQEQETEQVQD